MNRLQRIISRLLRSYRKPALAAPPQKNEPPLLEAILAVQNAYKDALDQESALGSRHRLDSFYTSSRGHNIGKDELIAVLRARELVLTPTDAERDNAVLYVNRLLADLEVIKQVYRNSEEDPEGYGIGTLHSLSRALAPFGKEAGLPS